MRVMTAKRFRWDYALLAGVLLAMLWCIPLSWIDHGPSVCVIKAVTGMECPGCGLTGAFFHLLHGDWRGAWTLNRRCAIVFPILAYVALKTMVRMPLGERD